MSFLASPRARLRPDQAVAATKPFFDERPIQGFFNTIGGKRASSECLENDRMGPNAAI